jgi:hypothetical protein
MVCKDSYAGYEALLDPLTVWEPSEAPELYRVISPMKGEEDVIVEIDSSLVKSEDFTRLATIVEEGETSVRISKSNVIVYIKYG